MSRALSLGFGSGSPKERYLGWIAEEGGRVAGSAGLLILDWPPHPLHPTSDKRGYLLNVYVEPEFRKRGLAKHCQAVPRRSAPAPDARGHAAQPPTRAGQFTKSVFVPPAKCSTPSLRKSEVSPHRMPGEEAATRTVLYSTSHASLCHSSRCRTGHPDGRPAAQAVSRAGRRSDPHSFAARLCCGAAGDSDLRGRAQARNGARRGPESPSTALPGACTWSKAAKNGRNR